MIEFLIYIIGESKEEASWILSILEEVIGSDNIRIKDGYSYGIYVNSDNQFIAKTVTDFQDDVLKLSVDEAHLIASFIGKAKSFSKIKEGNMLIVQDDKGSIFSALAVTSPSRGKLTAYIYKPENITTAIIPIVSVDVVFSDDMGNKVFEQILRGILSKASLIVECEEDIIYYLDKSKTLSHILFENKNIYFTDDGNTKICKIMEDGKFLSTTKVLLDSSIRDNSIETKGIVLFIDTLQAFMSIPFMKSIILDDDRGITRETIEKFLEHHSLYTKAEIV